MPSVMDVARYEVADFADGVVGSGIYYHEVRKREDESNVNFTIAISRLDTVLRQAMSISATDIVVQSDLDRLGLHVADMASLDRLVNWPVRSADWFEEQVGDYLDHIEGKGLFDQGCTLEVARGRIIEGAAFDVGVDISSSHCMRLNYSSEEAARLMREFRQSLSETSRR